ncbi:hypothetical protein QBC44DRAFT_44681 [Cladorrhinum sp. PSN332]|nr:hypothetical protein QBC44DRAFT_44681 [Cladorrhinum sp. PSN332]
MGELFFFFFFFVFFLAHHHMFGKAHRDKDAHSHRAFNEYTEEGDNIELFYCRLTMGHGILSPFDAWVVVWTLYGLMPLMRPLDRKDLIRSSRLAFFSWLALADQS